MPIQDAEYIVSLGDEITALREENARLKEQLAKWESQDIHESMQCYKDTERLTRERDEARAEVAEYHAEEMVPANAWAHDLARLKRAEAEVKRHVELLQHAEELYQEELAEVKRLEGLILDWMDYYDAPMSESADDVRLRGAVYELEAEARRIRAQRQEGTP